MNDRDLRWELYRRLSGSNDSKLVMKIKVMLIHVRIMVMRKIQKLLARILGKRASFKYKFYNYILMKCAYPWNHNYTDADWKSSADDNAELIGEIYGTGGVHVIPEWARWGHRENMQVALRVDKDVKTKLSKVNGMVMLG